MYLQWGAPLWIWILLLPLAGVFFFWTHFQYFRSEPALSAGRRRLLVGLRSVAFGVLLLAICGPIVLVEKSREVPAEVVVVVDDSASMVFGSGTDDVSRWQQALEAAAIIDVALFTHSLPVEVTLLRGNGIEALQTLDVADTVTAPVAVGSDLEGVLRQVVARWADRPLRGLVLIGDGYDTGATSVSELGRPPAGLATFGLGTGDTVGPPDRLLRELRYPDLAWEDDDIVVEVAVSSLHVPSGDETPLRVSLSESGELVALAEAPAADGLIRLELVFSPAGAGLRVYELEVEPLVNEGFRDNNKATLAIDVRKERARVLLLAGQPGWNTRFLAQAAVAEPRLDVAVAYRSAAGLVLADSTDGAGRLRPWAPPRDAAGWRQWDGLVVADGRLPDILDVEALSQAIEAGLGFFWMEGPASGNHRDRIRGLPRPGLLPVEGRRPTARSGSWRMRMKTAGDGHALLAGVDFSVVNLPPLGDVYAAECSAVGSVLLTARDIARPDLELPLLVVEETSAGRKAWFGGGEVWKCAFWEGPKRVAGSDEHPVRRLLRNLLVWTALGGEDIGLTLVGGRTVYREGERIRVEARRHDLRGRASDGEASTVRLRCLSEGAGEERVFSLDPVPGAGHLAATILPPLPAGRYLLLPGDGRDDESRGRNLVVCAGSLEDSQLRQGRRLRGVLRSLGGEFLAVADSSAALSVVAALLEGDLNAETRILRSRVHLRRGWPLLALLVCLLGAEWYLRRRWALL